jgi:8-amino-7-oxononanoate synthase
MTDEKTTAPVPSPNPAPGPASPPKTVGAPLSTDEKRGLLKRMLRGAVNPSPTPSIKDVPARFYRPEAFPALQEIELHRKAADRMGIRNPFFMPHEGIPGGRAVIGGRDVLNFGTYNYLGLVGDPRVNRAAVDALERYGTSAGASRLVAGERPIHRALEGALAEYFGCDDALVFVSGHGTNVTAIGHLMGAKDLILHDEWIHNSVLLGAALSGAHRRSFSHNNWEEADRFLARNRGKYEKVLLVVEGLYSMDGDVAPVDRFVEVKRKHRALLMVDEAHSLGVVGAHGGGVREHFGLDGADVDLWMGTLSKSLASQGGVLAGSRAMIEVMRYTCPGFVYSVGLAPPLAGAALEALRLLRAEPERVTRLQANGRVFLDAARGVGLDVGPSEGYAVVPVVVGNSLRAARASNRLLEHGVHALPILHPAVPEKRARLRFFLSAAHTEDELLRAVALTRQVLDEL